MKSLKKNAEYTKAVIIGIKLGTQGSHYVDYEYFVNGKKFRSRVSYQPRKPTFYMYPIIVGDTCVIAYDRENPEISTLYQDFTM